MEAIWLVPCEGVQEAAFLNGACTSITLREGYRFARYDFTEGSAVYSQHLEGTQPLQAVVHELSFSMPWSDCGAVAAAADLASGGCAAIILTAAGTALVAGISPLFGCECPLRAAETAADTRAEYDDDAYASVTLRSLDVSFSAPYTGAMP